MKTAYLEGNSKVSVIERSNPDDHGRAKRVEGVGGELSIPVPECTS